MNEKKFNRALNLNIDYQILTSSTIEELVKKEKKDFFNNSDIIVLLRKNLIKIINNTSESYRIEMINYLYQFDELKLDIEKILFSVLKSVDYYYLENLSAELEIKILEVINNNFDDFLNSKKLNCLIHIKNKWSNAFTKENLIKYNSYIASHETEFARSIIERSRMQIPLNKPKDYDIFITMMATLIKELKDHGKVNYSDIMYLGSGAYSSVYKIGDKVLKIGCERGTYQIGNDKRLLQPLLRINLNDSFDLHGTVEIANEVDTKVKLSKQEFYSLFKELRDRGIFYTDIRMDNLGYLLQDNTYNWYEQLGDDPTIRGLDRKLAGDEILKKGEIVVIDTDHFYNSELVRKINYGNSKIRIFEKRYQRELKDEQHKKI